MSLLIVRQKVIKFSGRYDLVTDGATAAVDNGADFFINAASRVLDMEGDQDRALKYYTGGLATDACQIQLLDCRAVLRVWWENSDGEWIKLEPARDYEELLEDYPELTGTESGTPLMWAREPIHRDPRNQGTSPSMATMGIVVMPPTDTGVNIRVYGKFYEKTLTENSDANYWSEEHPLLLTYAALREMETTYRNTQGASDWENRVQKYLASISKEIAEASDAYTMEMEG